MSRQGTQKVVRNEANVMCVVKQVCLRCRTFTKNEAHGSCKCRVKSSCPGWTKYVVASCNKKAKL